MSGYNISVNPANFRDLTIYDKPAPNFEANTIAAKEIDWNATATSLGFALTTDANGNLVFSRNGVPVWVLPKPVV